MKKVILYIAESLDGFIAKKDGDVSWLEEFNSEKLGINTFLDSIDTTVQGNTTFRQFGTASAKKNNYVFTHEDAPKAAEGVAFVKGSTKEFIENLDENTHKNIWIVGGANLLSGFMNENQVDEIILFIMPILLGEGISLFDNLNSFPSLKTLTTEKFSNGVVKIHYKVKK